MALLDCRSGGSARPLDVRLEIAAADSQVDVVPDFGIAVGAQGPTFDAYPGKRKKSMACSLSRLAVKPFTF